MTDVSTTPRGHISRMQRLRIFEDHHGICCLCNRKIDGAREAWIIEHPRALGLGGADDDTNKAPAHERCRRVKDKADVAAIAKAKRVKARHLGLKKSGRPMVGSRASGWKHRMDGTWERRNIDEVTT
ncbi:MAG: hypothetical protein ACOY4R_27390 [Pseudomonadota bacterium]